MQDENVNKSNANHLQIKKLFLFLLKFQVSQQAIGDLAENKLLVDRYKIYLSNK